LFGQHHCPFVPLEEDADAVSPRLDALANAAEGILLPDGLLGLL
jgi:hypothetical protein